eukprot:5068670-Lingulodinium_polyedra.AAC.1
MQAIMVAGRWASERSARLYVTKGEVLVLRVQQRLAANERAPMAVLGSAAVLAFETLLGVGEGA